MTEWRTIGYLRQGETRTYDYTLTLPRPLADWDVWDYWEREHIESVRDILHQGLTLIEVGSEHGWMSTVFAKIVGPENMVLVEPSCYFWPNIRQTWNRNFGVPPRVAWRGLCGPVPNTNRFDDGWPECAEGPLSEARPYCYLHEHPEMPTARLDDLAAAYGFTPDGVTIDVEGAELEVLCGAERLLSEVRPYVWVAIHPDLMARHYATKPEDLHRWMDGLGYRGSHLATDHEEHWLFTP